ncbi:hypothetical protein ACHAWO_000010 [Cyclotella atomus]|jgi:hypothetical protein|uniref:Mitochondrial carrier protein n=1 Tax=Cyclotella atomus TaxID=382360 RepID=A0ABD3QHN0_9STRA
MAEGWKDFVAGTVGGFSGKLLDYPFDTVKVLLQTQNSLDTSPSSPSSKPTAAAHHNHPITSSPLHTTIQHVKLKPPQTHQPVYRGAIHCLTHTIQTRGFFSLYNGLPAPLLGSMAENAVLFLSYGHVKRLLGETSDQPLSLLQLSIAGAAAGGITSFVLNPFEVIKCQMQVMNSDAYNNTNSNNNSRKKYKGFIDCIIQTIKNEGITKGLYRGQTSLLLREIPGNFCWYGVYEGVCYSQIPIGGTKRDLGPKTHLIGGAAAGVAYWTAFYPADTVGSQLRANPSYSSKGFGEVFMEIYRREGVRGLYRGWGITVLRAAPAHALIFAMYEWTVGVFRRWDPGMEDCLDKRSGSISHSA